RRSTPGSQPAPPAAAMIALDALRQLNPQYAVRHPEMVAQANQPRVKKIRRREMRTVMRQPDPPIPLPAPVVPPPITAPVLMRPAAARSTDAAALRRWLKPA